MKIIMKMKQVIFFILIGLAGILIGLAGFWLGPAFEKGGGHSVQSVSARISDALEAPTGSFHSALPYDKDLFDALFKYSQPVSSLGVIPISAVLPHHLVAGSYEIGMLEAVAKKITPPVVVIISPNHFSTGHAQVITGLDAWQTPYGVLEIDNKIVKQLAADGASIDDTALKNEHGVGALVGIIKKIWPQTKLVPIITRAGREFNLMDDTASDLAKILPKNSLVLASVDFSHYLPEFLSNWHDELSINVLETGDYNRLERLEIDSQNSIRLLLKYNEIKNAQKFNLVFHTNSADIIKNPDLAETTSHVMGYFASGESASSLVSIQLFGDMMLDRNVAKKMGDEGLDYLFADLKGQENRFFYGQDLLVANLEGPFAPTRVYTSKEIAFQFDPALAPQLKRYNFSAFSLANNHTFDMGRANADFTKTILTQNKLGFFGSEYAVNEGDIWVAGGELGLPEPVAFVGLNFTEGGVTDSQIKQIVMAAKKLAENVIVMPHWGQEYDNISNTTERDRAHLMIDVGATVVMGGHPHVIQEMEIYKGAPIFFSLGNFIFDQYFSGETQEGLSVGLTLSAGHVKNIYTFPFYSVKSQDFLMTGARRDNFFEWFNDNSRLDGKKFESGKLILDN
ncbi:MAG: AmmeMemoRadiSam system protein B [Candidatus Magasanikbacteria bacterium RIFOXYD2_FULL_41_14]|uniref:AmmeMemoRadiSam system protein B n=1 Tax=Candidatus Magasanikbacteria bacterium RIFOXYD2_FULL_41_14 TaxID=1798709 RepID=A0A1F6PDL7_9BACT|nr:MAG: AmmeMemoRadiSam system protein B [Candidatus Magasanikbacteria bacterium RIFOXYD2_FULL_41_14]